LAAAFGLEIDGGQTGASSDLLPTFSTDLIQEIIVIFTDQNNDAKSFTSPCGNGLPL